MNDHIQYGLRKNTLRNGFEYESLRGILILPKACPPRVGVHSPVPVGELICACREGKQAAAPPPPEVEVAEIVTKDVPIINEWVGSADGLVNATIRAQVTGYLIKQEYSEGDLGKKGRCPVRDRSPAFPGGRWIRRRERSRKWRRNTRMPGQTSQRVRTLAAQNALSKKDLDDATGAERSTGAAVVAARAAVEKARLDLGFTRIISPIDGIAGIARAQVGDLVGPSQGGELATVSMIDPIKVYYTITEQAYIELMKRFPSAGRP